MTADDLRAFEQEVAEAFDAGKIRGPVHLSGGNEDYLIEIFKDIARDDYVFSTWRNHYHALLHGIPRERVMDRILAGKSMNLMFPEHRFFTSAIVGGCLPIAVGVAAALKRKREPVKVWCFLGDMAETTGIFHEAHRYACGQDLPITFVVEDNGLSTNTPTKECWGKHWMGKPRTLKTIRYEYKRTWPHVMKGSM